MAISQSLEQSALSQLFIDARTHNSWQDKPVTDEQIKDLYELLKFAPTSVNCNPARFLFIKSPQAKERLLACVTPGNLEKTRAAPVTAIIGMDLDFYEQLPKLFPHVDAKSWFVGKDAYIESTAFRNSALQGAYLTMAVRALGLDCGAMSGFDADKVNAEFFPDGRVKVNFLLNIGYGNSASLMPRQPRPSFAEVCRIL
ncbi:MAG: malonic semialdehyde reductase [Betaproteobacteria bacterium]|jgi:3-hydroxypropanoate dehydrogenase|uniref:malonic semialdehyde reductase n=1 Tax=Polynucleobacter finlandensis TaxID=1855894 RepID=UPI001C0CE514|nr:malonic semialdehyde reductase [Polynucleobacter finlandensis]MBU3544451.1 malonic semialdehyde reductase [Polynucleobacter finlandensis]